MRIKFLSDDKIDTLNTKENLPEIEKYIKCNDTNEWLKDLFREEEPFSLSKVEMGECVFDMSAENPEDGDFENAKRLFQALRISESMACDSRLWAGLTFGPFYNYMKYRYNPDVSKNYVAKRWLFPGEGKKRDLFRQGISWMWWYVYLTYDDTLENPFELTEFCFSHRDFLMSIYYRAFSSAKNVRLALIQAYRDFERDGGNIEGKDFQNGIVKYMSFLGGAYLIDMFSRDELYEKVYDELIRRDEERNKEDTKRFKLGE